MIKIWGRIFKGNRMLQDAVCTVDNPELTRTHKIFSALEQICLDLDLANPIWLDSNIRDFQTRGRTRFGGDNFVEPIDFDYLDFYIIEED